MTPEEYNARKATFVTVEEFAAGTPEVAADRIRCTECSEEFIGDESQSTICPTCKREMGL